MPFCRQQGEFLSLSHEGPVCGLDPAVLPFFRNDLSVCASGTLHYDDNRREIEEENEEDVEVHNQ